MPFGEATLHEDGGQWVVRLEGYEGRCQLYHCATREQAERLCALFRQPLKDTRSTSGGTQGGEKPRRGTWFLSRVRSPTLR